MTITPGSLDHYRAMAAKDPHIAALVGLIDHQAAVIVKALETIVELKIEQKKEENENTNDQA